ncbi:MAG: TetR/AcrR family transcriptional regulator [Acidimicrobiales bacterium]
MPAGDTKMRILRAAEDVVIRDGVTRLTLEGAAQEAGMSKGGVLYHYPSRSALVGAMVERFVECFDADLRHYGAYGGKAGDFVRAYVEASVSPTETQVSGQRERRLGAALIASVASDPELLQPLRDRFDAWQAAVANDGLDASTATLIRLALDGMWLCDVFGLAPVSDAQQQAMAELLRQLITRAVKP